MMVLQSPLRKQLTDWPQSRRPDPQAVAHRPGAAQGHQTEPPAVEFLDYGPAGRDAAGACELVATFGDIESEYAAVRRGAGLLDSPHRATLLITGGERRDFLNRMLTQELKDLDGGGGATARQAFWLNRRGRIEADLLLIELGDRMFIDLDIHCAERAATTLDEFLFAEDVRIVTVTETFHHVGVHGPQAPAVIAAAAADESLATLGDLVARAVQIGGVEVVVARRDQTGGPGFELIMPRSEAVMVWDTLLAAGEKIGEGRSRVRPIGWHAFNVARIEAGTPLYNIDFGPDNLPHETGLISRRVSFTKGCYLGQEIVARTENLGRAKQELVGLRPARDLLPEAGDEVLDGEGNPVGAITSSTLSPMLGAMPIAFAMIRSAHAEAGTTVHLAAEGERTEAVVGPLSFYEAVAS